MEEFYQELLHPLFYRWISYQDNVERCDDAFYIENGDIKGNIQFHEEGIVEISAFDLKSHQEKFYLHFEMHDMKTTLEQFKTFFEFLAHHTQEEKVDIIDSQTRRILLSCTGGLTTSYFASAMQDILDKEDIKIQVDAIAYSDIDSVAAKYDVILLAPQIAYKLNEMEQKYGSKVFVIGAYDFATKNFRKILEKAL